MGFQVLHLGFNDDGTPHDLYVQDDEGKTAGAALLVTGPIVGPVTMDDGTVYDLTPAVIEVAAEHHVEAPHRVALRYLREGHPKHQPTDGDPNPEPFAYVPPAEFADQLSPLELALCSKVMNRHETLLRTLGDATMALASTAAENAALNGLDGTGTTNVIPFTSLHTATTGTTGASENAATGGYARQATTWNAAASGAKTNSTSLSFSTAGTTAVAYIGTWSLVTAGVFAIGAALGSSVTAATILIASGAASWNAT